MVSMIQETRAPVPDWYVIPLDAEETLGQMLRRLRAERAQREGREISQRAVAEALGLEPEQQNVISKYESGSIKLPNVGIITALAEYYGVDANALMLAAYRSSRGGTRPVPRNSYAVPGDPLLLRHLEVLRELKPTQVEQVTEHAVLLGEGGDPPAKARDEDAG